MSISRIRSKLKGYLSEQQRERLQVWANHSRLLRWYYRSDLTALATLYGSNKWRDHWYAQHYQTHFQRFRKKPINILEIGVGGYDNPHAGGASLRMWKAFFPRGHVFSIDINDKSPLEEHRIRIFKGSQNDPEFLKWVAAQIGRIDIIVDDGSHVSEHVITSFNTLFPLLAVGGVYAIEDLQFSYWPDFGGSEDPLSETTSMSLCKRLIDGINWQEFTARDPSYFDKHIVGMHFYHNLAIIDKAVNEETSGLSPEARKVFLKAKHQDGPPADLALHSVG